MAVAHTLPRAAFARGRWQLPAHRFLRLFAIIKSLFKQREGSANDGGSRLLLAASTSSARKYPKSSLGRRCGSHRPAHHRQTHPQTAAPAGGRCCHPPFIPKNLQTATPSPREVSLLPRVLGCTPQGCSGGQRLTAPMSPCACGSVQPHSHIGLSPLRLSPLLSTMTSTRGGRAPKNSWGRAVAEPATKTDLGGGGLGRVRFDQLSTQIPIGMVWFLLQPRGDRHCTPSPQEPKTCLQTPPPPKAIPQKSTPKKHTAQKCTPNNMLP